MIVKLLEHGGGGLGAEVDDGQAEEVDSLKFQASVPVKPRNYNAAIASKLREETIVSKS